MRSSIKPFLRFAEGPPEGAGGAVVDEPGTEQPEPAEQPQEGEDGEEGEEEPDGEAFDPARALAKIAKLNSEAANLRKRAKEAEEKASTTDEAAKKVPALEAELLRLRVAVKHGLPEKIATRLQGSTEEELLADAQELLETFSPKRPPSQRPTEALRGGGDPTAQPEETDLDRLGERMFRQ